MLASGADDNTVILWNVAKKKRLDILKGHADWVQAVVFSPDGTILASGSSDKTVILWDVESRKQFGHPQRAYGTMFFQGRFRRTAHYARVRIKR